MTSLEKSIRPLFPLYAVLDADVAGRAGWTLPDLASACLSGGARLFQIRAKHASSGWLLDVTSAITEQARTADATVVVNDRADVARMANAGGVHVGQDDLPAALARTIVGEVATVGLSTHTSEQIDTAVGQPISYLAIGPVFDTSTKATGYTAVGLAGIRNAVERGRGRGLPVVAIGGITLDTAGDVIDAGASSVAVISDLLSDGDPERRVRTYIQRLS
jgi:thiamine-phosphate pyrophosphorylase